MSLPSYNQFDAYMTVTRDSGHINMFDAPKYLQKRFKKLSKEQAERLTSLWVFGTMTYNKFNDVIFERSKV